jgi:hypothetical protein
LVREATGVASFFSALSPVQPPQHALPSARTPLPLQQPESFWVDEADITALSPLRQTTPAQLPTDSTATTAAFCSVQPLQHEPVAAVIAMIRCTNAAGTTTGKSWFTATNDAPVAFGPQELPHALLEEHCEAVEAAMTLDVPHADLLLQQEPAAATWVVFIFEAQQEVLADEAAMTFEPLQDALLEQQVPAAATCVVDIFLEAQQEELFDDAAITCALPAPLEQQDEAFCEQVPAWATICGSTP